MMQANETNEDELMKNFNIRSLNVKGVNKQIYGAAISINPRDIIRKGQESDGYSSVQVVTYKSDLEDQPEAKLETKIFAETRDTRARNEI